MNKSNIMYIVVPTGTSISISSVTTTGDLNKYKFAISTTIV